MIAQEYKLKVSVMKVPRSVAAVMLKAMYVIRLSFSLPKTTGVFLIIKVVSSPIITGIITCEIILISTSVVEP